MTEEIIQSKWSCKTCRWWDPRNLENKGVGLCRFSPPVIQGRLLIGQWPVTSTEDWCGDFAYPPETDE